MPANCIACVSHMLCDEHVLACLIPLSVSVPAEVRPAILDEQKSNGDSMSNIAYQEMYANYKNWIKEYINPYCDGPFEEDLGCSYDHYTKVPTLCK